MEHEHVRQRNVMTHLSSHVLIVGAGGAGMYAAVAAAREGARVLLGCRSGEKAEAAMAKIRESAPQADIA